jgi:nucleoside 2-deoxyribosyltransferase
MLIYIAGPYRGSVDTNIAAARKVAAECYKAGHDVICPHLNSAKMDEDTGLPDEFWLQTTMNLLKRCDAIVLVPGWQNSSGSKAEVAYAKSVGMSVYEDVPDLHATEKERPLQVSAFIEMLMKMYRVHLSKNADYSPANILATGEIGVIVRLWDKIARLLNLTGFKVEIAASGYVAPKQALHESIDDTLLDAANYAVIAKLLRDGLWGR